MSNMYPPEVTIPVYSVFTGVAIFLTGARLYARAGYTKARLGIDDALITFGVLIVAACCGIQLYNAIAGTGGNAVTDKDSEARAIASKKVDFIMVFIEKPAFGCIKLSLLFFYKRIFSVWPSFTRINTILIWIVFLWMASFMIADLTICGTNIHYEFLLDQSYAKASCADKGLLLLLFAITSLITDIAVLALPFFYIKRLQMPPQKKWATYAVFFLGFVSTAASLLRVIFLCIAYPMGRMGWGYKAPEGAKTPLVLEVFNPTFWIMVEMCLGAWAANLPPLGPLLGAMGFREFVHKAYRTFSQISNTFGSSQKSRRASEAVHVQPMQRPSDGSEASLVREQSGHSGPQMVEPKRAWLKRPSMV